MAVTTVDVGDNVTVPSDTTTASPHKPRWLEWDGTATISANLEGSASLPSGYKRFATGRCRNVLNAHNYDVREYAVNPPALPADPGTPWRCMIYAPDGHYCVMDGLPGSIPTVGTPRVRLTENGPSRAVVRIPVTASILSSSFSGWDDGHAEAVTRGMELTVEYRTPGGSLTLVFRGRIFEAEAGEVVTVTAYDRLMDLALCSDQYTPSTKSYIEDEVSLDRATSGSDYVYTMQSEVGTVANANPVDRLRIDCLSAQGTIWYDDLPGYGDAVIHNLPSVTDNGVTYGVTKGRRIYRLAIQVSWDNFGSDYTHAITATFYICRVSTAGVVTILETHTATLDVGTADQGTNQEIATGSDDPVDFAVDDPARIYVGVSVSHNSTSGSAFVTVRATAHGSHITTSKYYHRDNGTWSKWETGTGPELAIDFDYIDTASDISASLTPSGSTVSLPQGTAPDIQLTYVTTQVKEAGICLSYQSADAVSVQDIVEGLIAGAGMDPSVDGGLGLGMTTYYTTSTYDYLSCIHELIRTADGIVRDSLAMPGTVSVLPRHTLQDAVAGTFSTDPMDGSEQSIASYSLTSRWAAERATVAILAENATSTGLPIALETDDWLMDNSLVEGIGSPMRSVTADKSSGTHALLANAAGGKVRQLHTNVIEGSVTLAGYRPDLWELTSASNAGGVPVALTVPQYGISDAPAIPTEIEMGDGVTVVTLDNIRRADRSEVANSMNLTADAISNGSGELPDTVWLFARVDMAYLRDSGDNPTVTSIVLRTTAGTSVATISGSYLKEVDDAVGYHHAVGVVPAQSPGIATGDPIGLIEVVTSEHAIYPICAVLDVPKNALANQAVHVDVRFRAS